MSPILIVARSGVTVALEVQALALPLASTARSWKQYCVSSTSQRARKRRSAVLPQSTQVEAEHLLPRTSYLTTSGALLRVHVSRASPSPAQLVRPLGVAGAVVSVLATALTEYLGVLAVPRFCGTRPAASWA